MPKRTILITGASGEIGHGLIDRLAEAGRDRILALDLHAPEDALRARCYRFITGDIKNKDAVQLSTPTTSLTIRGTKFILAVAADGTTTLGVLEGAVDVAPCGGAQSVRENTGQAVQVSTSCKSNSVDLGSVPTDFATAGDYDVSENNAGAAPGTGR